jgi:hypothetical protein
MGKFWLSIKNMEDCILKISRTKIALVSSIFLNEIPQKRCNSSLITSLDCDSKLFVFLRSFAIAEHKDDDLLIFLSFINCITIFISLYHLVYFILLNSDNFFDILLTSFKESIKNVFLSSSGGPKSKHGRILRFGSMFN